MLAGVYDGSSLKIVARPNPTLKDIEAPLKYNKKTKITFRKNELALIEVIVSSICGTDLHILNKEHDSNPPVILGHEYIGRVLETGRDVANVRAGDFVAVDPNIKCGYCEFCRKGMLNLCLNITTLGIFLDGGFAEYNVLPAKQLIKLPDHLPITRTIFFEPLTCVTHGINKVSPRLEDNILIFGGGPIGAYFAFALSFLGQVTVVEPNEYRRNFLSERNIFVVKDNSNLEKETFDVVIDACGIPAIVPQAIDFTKRSGKLLLFGQQNIHANIMINPTIINQKELQVFGSYITSSSFEDTLKLLSDFRIPWESLITHKFELKNLKHAFEAMKSSNALEILIQKEA